MKVLLEKVPMSNGTTYCWVALELTQDVATQTPLGGTIQNAIEELTYVFEVRDMLAKRYADEGIRVNEPNPAPQEYWDQWDAAEPIGAFSLGAIGAMAECRVVK